MTYSAASILYDTMAPDRRARVIQIFEAIIKENTLGVREAFVAAVDDELKAIETEIQLGQAKGATQ